MVRSWPEIEKTYQEYVKADVHVQAMLNLVKNIESSPYVSGLYAWISMHDLCIVQNQVTYPYEGPYLRISPLFNGKVEFRYIDTFIKEKQWCREVDEQDIFARLEGVIKQLHWFVSEQHGQS